MQLKEINIGDSVRYENQRWKGIVTGFRASENSAIVSFEGDGADELIDVGFLRPF